MTCQIITSKLVDQFLNPSVANKLAEDAFRLLAKGYVDMPPKSYVQLKKGDFRAMPCAIDSPKLKAVGIKWVSVYPQNPSRKLPTVQADYLLNDPETAQILALMDASVLTAYRTGASGAIASKYLAKSNPRNLLLVGLGTQAVYQLWSHLAEFPSINQIYLWSPKESDSNKFLDRIKKYLPKRRVQFQFNSSLQKLCGEIDIICTTTPSTQPLIMKSWVRGGTHINAIGADAPGKQELDPQLLKRAAKVVVDEIHQASHSGEINVAIHKGLFKQTEIFGQLGDLILKKPNRKPDDITIFDSTGLAVQDLMLAHYVYRKFKTKKKN